MHLEIPTMKSFREYLAESVKEYSLVLRFACKLEDNDVDRLERFLGKYDLRTMTRVSTTPISKSSIYFKDVENAEVSKVEIKTGYPMAADILRQQLADLLEMNITHILVHKPEWQPEEEEEVSENEPALLDSEYDDTSDNGKNYGKNFVTDFLKSLTKRETATVENELSVKPKADKGQEQMSTEEGSSKSVISGDEDE